MSKKIYASQDYVNEKIAELNKKSTFSGSYNDLTDKPIIWLAVDESGLPEATEESATIISTPVGAFLKIKYYSSGLSYTLKSDNTYEVSRKGGCRDLDVIIPPTYLGLPVTSIGFCAFYMCENLRSVIIPDSVTTISSDVFGGCENLRSVVIPDSVTSIGEQSFDFCSGLTSVTIGNSVTSIGNTMFRCCDNLTSVIIGNSVTSIGYQAFLECSSLTSVIIPDSVVTIGARAFSECSRLESVIIGNGVTSIGREAFGGCHGLTSVIIGNSVASIEDYAFNGINLSEVYYNGTESEWSAIAIGSGNYYLNSATIYYYSETQPTTSGNYWHYVDGEPVIWIV